jgi:hypothetical protein
VGGFGRVAYRGDDKGPSHLVREGAYPHITTASDLVKDDMRFHVSQITMHLSVFCSFCILYVLFIWVSVRW